MMTTMPQFAGKFLLKGTPEEIKTAWDKLAEKRKEQSWSNEAGEAQERPMPLNMWGHQGWCEDTVTGDTFQFHLIQDGKNPETGNPARAIEVREVWTAADSERHQKGEKVAEKLPGMIERMTRNAAKALIDFIADTEPEELDPVTQSGTMTEEYGGGTYTHTLPTYEGTRFDELVKNFHFWHREADTVQHGVNYNLGMRMNGDMSDDPERPTYEASELITMLDEGRFDIASARPKEPEAAPAVEEAPVEAEPKKRTRKKS